MSVKLYEGIIYAVESGGVLASEIYSKGGEKIVILGKRNALLQEFQADNWMDLRVGFFMSLTDKVNDDLTTGLQENLITGDPVANNNKHWIGLKDRSRDLPQTAATQFMGFSNQAYPGFSGSSQLISSGQQSNSDDGHFWRSVDQDQTNDTWSVWDGTAILTNRKSNPIFAQDAALAGGYAVLAAFRSMRDSPTSKNIRWEVTRDILSITSTPTVAILHDKLENWTPNATRTGDRIMSGVPNSLFCYWPYDKSRLRLHAIGIVAKTTAPPNPKG